MIDLVIIGNLTKDPAQRTVNGTNGPKTVADFTVAVNGRRQGEEPTFVRVTVWEKTAENCCKYLAKGRKVAIRADNIAAHTYTRQDGQTGVSLEVTARDVEFLTPKAEGQPAAAPAPAPAPKPEQYQQVDAGDDLPF